VRGARAQSTDLADLLAGYGSNPPLKSVTIKTISGLWPPDEGEVLWQGQPVQLHGPKDAEALG
jgi:ABC-type sugar transport system ATPase subunit